ncbi:MAG: hypothetical protein HY296_07075 [Thaumarchaeota archaeon]|nr:hypothetical protein [Nitrososphaerota archaeon]
MRQQLFGAGLLIAGTGILLYVIGSLFPQTYVDTSSGQVVTVPGITPVFSVPFIIGGAVMIAVSPLLKPSELPIPPSEGYKYCVFCSKTIPTGSQRCDRCNGIQPKG